MSQPHWMPKTLWVGVTIGQWPLESWSGGDAGQAKAQRWAAEDPEKRRIFSVAVPENTVAFQSEIIPATTKMTRVHP